MSFDTAPSEDPYRNCPSSENERVSWQLAKSSTRYVLSPLSYPNFAPEDLLWNEPHPRSHNSPAGQGNASQAFPQHFAIENPSLELDFPSHYSWNWAASNRSKFPASITPDCSASDSIETSSPSASRPSSLSSYGIPVPQTDTSKPPMWRCAYPSCTSRQQFRRSCDLRKHFHRHSKHLFCRLKGCPQSKEVAAAASEPQNSSQRRAGFTSIKDRARHEARHNPQIRCEWLGAHNETCDRMFSRIDNMRDHMKRVHQRIDDYGQQKLIR